MKKPAIWGFGLSDLEKLIEGVEVPLSLLLRNLSKHMHDDDDDDDVDDGDDLEEQYFYRHAHHSRLFQQIIIYVASDGVA